MKFLKKNVLTAVFMLTAIVLAHGQKENKAYEFSLKKEIPVTAVKNQYRSGTCWSYASVSFLEAELLRMGKGEYDLSEMFYVRKAYELKAEKYVRMHGKTNFGGGGLAMDVLHIWDKYGAFTEEAYNGLTIGEEMPVHGEMDVVLSGYVDQVIKNRNRSLTPVWKKGFNGILDAYLGEVPGKFEVGGREETALSFAEGLELEVEDYVVVGSFTHHPFYKPFVLEIPDNWIWGSIQNVPLNELMEILDRALDKGYSVCWDADVGEKGFDWKKGVALIPTMEIDDLDGLERGRWDELSASEKQAMIYDFSERRKEKKIDQETRQLWFDNYQTTDDHLMHITGWATDQDGKRFYQVKNSWGTENHIFDGFLYASESYMRAKTIFFVVHKDALTADMAGKLGF